MATTRFSKTKSREELMRELDERLKLNRGSFSALASETGSNTPFLTNQGKKVVNPTGLEDQKRLTVDLPEAPLIPQLPELPQNEELPQEEQPQQQTPASRQTQQEFLQQIFNQAWEPKLPSVDQLEYLYQRTGRVYGVQSLPDGSVLNNDGSITQNQGQQAMPIASMPDGTILWSDGFVRERPPEGLSGYLAGVSGLSQLVLGQNQPVTQAFGNYNPTLEPGTGYNLGTDLRTRDLSQRELYAPIPLQIVEVFQDDGTRWGEKSGHQGYGNSVLVRLPSGEMLRLSHLASMGNFQPGQIINPGDLIGTPGQTGNTSGEHLDLEYYNKDGQIDDPANFKLNADAYNIGNEVVGITPQQYSSFSSQPQQNSQPRIETPMTDAVSKVADPVINAAKAGISAAKELPQQAGQVLGAATQAAQPMSPQRQALGTGTGQIAKKTGLDAELGVGESIAGANPSQARISALSQQPQQYNPYRQLVGNIFERVGDTLGVPEGALSETIAGGPTKRTNQAIANEIGQTKPDQVKGIRQNIFDISQDVSSNIRQAGEGVKELGRSGLDALQNVFQKKPLLGGEGQRVVGEKSAGGDQVESFDPKQTEPNDIRDEFFKSGLDKSFTQFIRPENIGEGALSLNLFSDDFYTGEGASDRIRNVFGGTFLQGEAEQKYGDWKSAEDARMQAERRAQENKSQPTLQDYLSRGKTVEQWYAETGKLDTLNSLRSRGIDPVQYARGEEVNRAISPAPVQGNFTPQQTSQIGSTSGKGVQSVTYPSGRTINASPNTSLRADSSGNIQQVMLGAEPVKSISAQANRQSGPNIFSRAASSIKNIFSR